MGSIMRNLWCSETSGPRMAARLFEAAIAIVGIICIAAGSEFPESGIIYYIIVSTLLHCTHERTQSNKPTSNSLESRPSGHPSSRSSFAPKISSTRASLLFPTSPSRSYITSLEYLWRYTRPSANTGVEMRLRQFSCLLLRASIHEMKVFGALLIFFLVFFTPFSSFRVAETRMSDDGVRYLILQRLDSSSVRLE